MSTIFKNLRGSAVTVPVPIKDSKGEVTKFHSVLFANSFYTLPDGHPYEKDIKAHFRSERCKMIVEVSPEELKGGLHKAVKASKNFKKDRAGAQSKAEKAIAKEIEKGK